MHRVSATFIQIVLSILENQQLCILTDYYGHFGITILLQTHHMLQFCFRWLWQAYMVQLPYV